MMFIVIDVISPIVGAEWRSDCYGVFLFFFKVEKGKLIIDIGCYVAACWQANSRVDLGIYPSFIARQNQTPKFGDAIL